jgi:hypothetical protein
MIPAALEQSGVVLFDAADWGGLVASGLNRADYTDMPAGDLIFKKYLQKISSLFADTECA